MGYQINGYITYLTINALTRAEQAALRSYFQQQGLTDEQALDAIKSYKEANKTKISPEAQANAVLIRADVTIQAGTLQIRPTASTPSCP